MAWSLVFQWWLQAQLCYPLTLPSRPPDPITACSVPARNQSLADARLDRPHRLTFRAPSLSPHAAVSGWGWQGGREPRYTQLSTRITCTLRYARYELGYWKLKARTTCRILFFNSPFQLPSPVLYLYRHVCHSRLSSMIPR